MSGKINRVEAFLLGLFAAGVLLILITWAVTGDRPGFGGLVALGLILLVTIGSRFAKVSGGNDAR